MRPVVIAGAGSTRFGRLDGRSFKDLVAEAGQAALADAGLERERIGALFLGNFLAGSLTGQEVLAGIAADVLGLGQIPCTKVEAACASGGIAFRQAWLAVATGQCEAAIAVGVEKMTHAATPVLTRALNAALDLDSDGPTGLTFPGVFGLAWSSHAHAYGTSRADVTAVVRKNKAAGLLNPLASMGAMLSAEEIEAAPLIADPMRRFDCCPVSDGASAIVLVAQHGASRRDRDVRVRASVQTRGPAAMAARRVIHEFEATIAAAHQACAAAGVTPRDLDLIELHDCFSVAEIVDAEDLGYVPRGAGGGFAREGRTTAAGDRPINPSGGLLAKGHPVGATGVGQIVEVVAQLRGEHANQVRGARLGLAHNLGGCGVACTVSILERCDA